MTKPHSSEQLALDIVRKLQQAGHVAYFAGGCVRDRLMGREPADFDVATSAVPEEVLKLFPRSQKVGVAFGVVIVRERRQQVEVATFRAEGEYSDGRRPDTVRFTNAEEDAKRRDFTCNGLFFDPVTEELHDFVGGRSDIKKKLLRAIGDPRQRFMEDHLRLLRAVRFAAKLEFDIEPETWQSMRSLAERIRTISRERIGEEVRMILEHPSRVKGMRLLALADLVGWIWPPELWNQTTPVLPSAVRTRFQSLEGPVTRTMVLVAIQRDLWTGRSVSARQWHEAAGQFQQYFMMSNQERDDFGWLAEKIDVLLERCKWTRPIVKRLMADGRWPQLKALYAAEKRGVDEEFEAFTAQLQGEGVSPEPFVTGDDLIKLGASPGPQFKAWLERLYDWQLDNQLLTREAALTEARRLMAGA